MKTFLNLFILSSTIIFFANCKKDTAQNAQKQVENTITETSVQNRELKRIDALYYNYIFDTATPVKPEDIRKDIPQFEKERKGVLDAEIADSLKIDKLLNLLVNLRPSEKQAPLDARIVFILRYSDESKDTLSIGGSYTNKLYLNGIEQATDNELLFALKNYIGFYPWLIGDDMFNMSELQDNSFPKPPFTSSIYYKQYQEALASR